MYDIPYFYDKHISRYRKGLYCSIAFLISIIITLPIPIYMVLALKQIKTEFSSIYKIVINLILTQYILKYFCL